VDNAADTFRHELRDIDAQIVLETCKTEGAKIYDYQDRQNPPKPIPELWAIPGAMTRELSNDGELQEEITYCKFTVPRQYSCSCGNSDCYYAGIDSIHKQVLLFPPFMPKAPGTNNPSINAQFRYQDRYWSVKKWSCDAVEAAFVLEAESHQPRYTSRE
jgi:hypothetical protein